MTKYTHQMRQDLYDKVLMGRATQRLLTKGVAATAVEHPGVMVSRAMGFNRQGKFSVNNERPEGSKNKWQRYFAKGCPELLEYLARLDAMAGQDFNPDMVFDKPIPRNKANEVSMECEIQTEAPEEHITEWIAQLPEWGELYTPKGLNFYVLIFLYKLEFGVTPNHKQLLYACDQYDSPYTIRFCQGKPQNDDAIELAYYKDTKLLLGEEYEPEALPEPVRNRVEEAYEYLRAQKLEKDTTRATEELIVAVVDCGSLDMTDVTIPTTLEEIIELRDRIWDIIALERDLGEIYKD